MKIYPKISEQYDGIDVVKPYIAKNRGMEVQMLSWDENEKIIGIIQHLLEEIPEIEEITVHPPLTHEYDFEVLSYCNFEKEKERVNCIIESSKRFNIKVNLLYHTLWKYICWKSSKAIERLKELLELVQNTNVNILLENIYSIPDKKDCAVLNVVKDIDNPHLYMCLDICHLHVQANIYKMQFDEFLNEYLNKEDCMKYIYQIHFAGTLDNDGYINIKKTHGKKHDTQESFESDYNILKKYEIENRIVVVEISEDDYTTRVDQIEEIKMLESKNIQ